MESRIASLGETCRIEIVKTSGDAMADAPLARAGGKGLFTKEIEDALLAGIVDVAVHSLKDMPTELPDGLALQAVPEREDVRDAMVGRRLAELAHGARVGTGSPRRAAQLKALRPDLVIEAIRGNVDTRLRKLDEGRYDAIVLAAAGLRRLGWAARIAELLPVHVMCPAAGQGALAIETRADEGAAARLCRQLNHSDSWAAVTAERALLSALGGGCRVPVGANAMVADGWLVLRAIAVAEDGSRAASGERGAPVEDAARAGAELGVELLANGAREILEAVYGTSLP